MRVVVTGAAGFIGSNIVKGLNARGIDDIIAVDDLTQGDKFRNLADLKIADYVDADVFYERFAQGGFGARRRRVSRRRLQRHHGDATASTCWTTTTRCRASCSTPASERGTRLLYASSAATYGGSETFREDPQFERPLNVYGYSKLLFDQRMRRECGNDFRANRAPGGGLSLLQRVRPARAAQGAHGQRRLPPVQPVPRRGQGQALRRVRRLRTGRTEARLRLRRRRGGGEPVVPRPSAARRASSTWAPVAHSRSMTSPCRSSTRWRRKARKRRWILPARRPRA